MSKKEKIAELRRELNAMVNEYLDNFDTYSAQESQYFKDNIKDKQQEIFDLERGKKNGKK